MLWSILFNKLAPRMGHDIRYQTSDELVMKSYVLTLADNFDTFDCKVLVSTSLLYFLDEFQESPHCPNRNIGGTTTLVYRSSYFFPSNSSISEDIVRAAVSDAPNRSALSVQTLRINLLLSSFFSVFSISSSSPLLQALWVPSRVGIDQATASSPSSEMAVCA